MMLQKYFKPQSITWWSGVIPLLLGVFLATQDVHSLQALVKSVDLMTGHIPPSALIIYGLTAIGLRGKDG